MQISVNSVPLCSLCRVRLSSVVFGGPRHQPWYGWLLRGSVRVPVPALVLLVVILSALTYLFPRNRQALPVSAREVSLSDFQPVTELKPRIIRSTHENN